MPSILTILVILSVSNQLDHCSYKVRDRATRLLIGLKELAIPIVRTYLTNSKDAANYHYNYYRYYKNDGLKIRSLEQKNRLKHINFVYTEGPIQANLFKLKKRYQKLPWMAYLTIEDLYPSFFDKASDYCSRAKCRYQTDEDWSQYRTATQLWLVDELYANRLPIRQLELILDRLYQAECKWNHEHNKDPFN